MGWGALSEEQIRAIIDLVIADIETALSGNKFVYPHSTEIADYSALLGATPSSDSGASYTEHMNVTREETDLDLSSDATDGIFAGEGVTATSSLIGKKTHRVKLRLRKNAAPTGTAYIGVWGTGAAPTSANYKHLFGTLDVSTLTTSFATYIFESTPYTLVSGDAIGIFYNGGTATNRVEAGTSNTNAFDTTNSVTRTYT
ncbi:MAG: hypothetical protein ACREAW_03000, partial [Nitrososphaera sp.]